MFGGFMRRPGWLGEPALRIEEAVFDAIRDTVGSEEPETGGMLGGDPTRNVVTHFYFDVDASRTRVTYSPANEKLTQILEREWNPAGVRLMGFVHSHPRGIRQPSGGDEVYARRILGAVPDMERLLLPIVVGRADQGTFELLPYAVRRSKDGIRVASAELNVVRPRKTSAEARRPFVVAGAFQRVRDAYDLELLHEVRVVVIGCGGAAEFIENLGRAGVGQFVLVDPDVVSETNLATQQTYRRDIGRPKVQCLAERLRDINPDVKVLTLQRSLDDIADEELGALLADPIDGAAPRVKLLCGMTDAFPAQARVNRLALNFGVPSLCAQVYEEGRGAEVTFTHPDTTPACHRCALNARYREYLRNPDGLAMTSDGTPISSTGRLNSLKFFVAMALLHHGSRSDRWGSMLRRIGKRNLIQLRMHPDLGLDIFDRVYRGADQSRVFADDTVWLPQDPDNPSNGFPYCPDCGGTGDLIDRLGLFSDTRRFA